jgi:hypothetical protein
MGLQQSKAMFKLGLQAFRGRLCVISHSTILSAFLLALWQMRFARTIFNCAHGLTNPLL